MTEKNRPQIPAIIHYCWFGQQEMSASALRCIESWRRFAPDFRLQRWDESNFDVDSLEYTAQAFRLRKYAFVSDVARLHALLSEGGIYLDIAENARFIAIPRSHDRIRIIRNDFYSCHII